MTVAQFVSDVELQLLQGAVSDDSELEKDQIKMWGSYQLNQLVANEINSKLARGESIPAIYIVRTELEVPELEEEDDVDELDERIFVELDNEVLTLNHDSGVVLVQTSELDEIQKADIQSMQLFKKMRFSKPSDQNPVYYRQDLKIFLEGFKPADLPFDKIFVFYVPKQDLLTMDEDDEILCSDLVLPEVINQVVQRGKLQMYGTQQDLESDGVDVKKTQYHTAISNPNREAQ